MFRPIIPIQLAWGDRELNANYYRALVDSGADWCLFHAEIGELLGIPIRDGERRSFVGIEGVENFAYFHWIRLIFGGMSNEIKAGFVEHFRFRYGILGQGGFFDHFVVTLSSLQPAPYVDINRLH